MRIEVTAVCLDDRPDRRAAVERELRRAGLAFRTQVASRPTDARGYASVGIRGCNESHLAALRHALDRDVDVVVICEDDLMILHRFAAAWPRITQTLTSIDWQFVHLGYKGRFEPSIDAPVVRISQDLGRLMAHRLVTAHFYAVHRSVLADLVEYLTDQIDEPPFAPIDGMINDFRIERGIFPLVAVPNLGVQRPSWSNLWPPESMLSRALHHRRSLKPALAAWIVAKRGIYEAQSRWNARHANWSPHGRNSR